MDKTGTSGRCCSENVIRIPPSLVFWSGCHPDNGLLFYHVWGGLPRQVTARLQIRGFPFFPLLPAGMGEPMIGRFEEEAREVRAEMRRRAALDEIDRAKEQQVSLRRRISIEKW